MHNQFISRLIFVTPPHVWCPMKKELKYQSLELPSFLLEVDGEVLAMHNTSPDLLEKIL
jgi:hypothetical protein